MGSYFDELVNSNISSISSKLSSVKSTDLSKIGIGSSVSSDKVFSAVSDSKVTSNVFGVFDSKQVVQELSGDTTKAFSTELIEDLDVDQLKNLSTKIGSEITTDIDFESAVDDVMGSMTDLKQQALSFSDDAFGSVVTVVTESGAEIKATLLENVSLSSTISEFIPGDMSLTDFDSLKNLFNSSSGFGNFNSCDALAAALGFASSLIDLNALFGNLKDLFGLLSKYDITGLIACVSEAFSSLDSAQMTDLSSSLISGGSVNGYSEFTALTNNGNVLDKYSTIRSLGSNTSSSSSTSALDSIFTNLSIDKSDVFTEQNILFNESIIDNSTESIYDLSSVASTSSSFRNYCFGSSDVGDVLSNIPESIFT